jgi:ParB/RepB/Spo0J family partition protein
MDTAITHTLTHLALGALAPSPTAVQAKRRKRYDKTALAELASSIQQSGVLQPIVARSLDAEHYEIVAGERRWLSAKAAGLPTIPAVVRSLTDGEVLTVQLVENLQREELHPLEEAEAYEELMRQGLTIEELMQKIGKKASSRAYVYARLKLCALSPASREAFYDGKLSASTALLIARIPGAKLQAEALADITAPRFGNEPMSARGAAAHLQEHYMLRLADAPFDRKDATLVPDAGPCGACPKRTGNQPELFGDVRGADVCTDPTCFAAKRAATNARRQAEARAQGVPVIAGAAAKKLAPNGARYVGGGYVALDETCHDDPKQRSYRQILAKQPISPTLLEDTRTGALVEIVKAAEVAPLLKSQGVVAPARGASPEMKAQKLKLRREEAYRTALLAAVRAKVTAPLGTQELAVVVGAYFEDLWHEHRKTLLKLWGFTESNPKGSSQATPHKKLAELPASELARCLIDCVLVGEPRGSAWNTSRPARLLTLAGRYRINPKTIRRQADVEFKDKAQAPASKKRKS